MKKYILLIIGLFLFNMTNSFAQVTEEEKSMQLGTHNALVIEVDNASKKIAEQEWKEIMKKYRGRTKKKRKEEQWTTDKLRFATITGQESGKVYAQIEESEENVVALSLWVPNGEGYVSSTDSPEAYEAAEKLLEDYALEVRIAVVEEEFGSKARILESYQKDLKKLKRDNDKYHKTIKDSEKAIKSSKKGLVDNEANQEKVVDELGAAEAIFEVANDTLRSMLRLAETKDEKKSIKKMIKTEEGKVKDVEKRLKKLRREEKKMYKTIEDSKDKIHQAEQDIVKNENDQERKNQQIQEQQAIVDEVQGRLDKLKSYRK